MAGNTDPRVQKTRQALQDALVTLTSERGFDAVTVLDVAARANVNRTTFYRHFRDKYELMRWAMEQTFSDMVSVRMPADPADFSFEDAVNHAEAVFTRISHHADICRRVFSLEGSALAVEARRLIERTMHHRLQVMNLEEPLVPGEIVAAMLIHGFMGTVGWWLQQGMPYSPREMAVHFIRLNSLGPYRCLGLERFARSSEA